MTTWTCPRCQEVISAAYRLCWNCGGDREGHVDPAVQAKIEATREGSEPDQSLPPPRRTLRLTLAEMAALVALVAVFLPAVIFQQFLARVGLRVINFLVPPVALAVLLVVIASVISRFVRDREPEDLS